MRLAWVMKVWCAALCVVAASGPAISSADTDPKAVQVEARSSASEEGLLAMVGDWPVYREDLERALGDLHSGIRTANRAAPDIELMIRRRLVADALLATEAAAIGMAEEEPIPSELARLEETMARSLLERNEIAARARVDDEDIQRIYRDEYRTVGFRRAVFTSRDEALAFRQQVVQGGDFGALAKELSIDAPGSEGGLIEGVPLIEIPRRIAAPLLESSGLEPTQPIEGDDGWEVLWLESVAEADESIPDAIEVSIRETLELGRRQELRATIIQELSSKYEISIDEDAVDAIECRFSESRRFVPTIDDPEAVVARVGKRLIRAGTLGGALLDRWRSVTSEDAALAIKPLVLERLVEGELLVAEALARGYANYPPVRRARHALLTRLLVERYIVDVMSASIEIDRSEVERYYEEHREEFRRPPKLRIGQITVADREEAGQVVLLLEEGADFAWLARQRSIDGFRDAGGDRGWVSAGQPLSPFEGPDLRTAEEGKVLGPREWDDNFVVLRVNGVEDQGIYPLDEVSGNVRERLSNARFGDELQRNLDSLSEGIEIVFYEENISKVSIGASLGEGKRTGHGGH